MDSSWKISRIEGSSKMGLGESEGWRDALRDGLEVTLAFCVLMGITASKTKKLVTRGGH